MAVSTHVVHTLHLFPVATPHIIARAGVEDGNTVHMVIVAANQPAPQAAPVPAAASGDSPLQQPVPSSAHLWRAQHQHQLQQPTRGLR